MKASITHITLGVGPRRVSGNDTTQSKINLRTINISSLYIAP